MSYVTGNFANFEQRLHEFGTNYTALQSFITEGNGYLASGSGVIPALMSGKWEKEARKCAVISTNSGVQYSTQQFQAAPALPVPAIFSIGNLNGLPGADLANDYLESDYLAAAGGQIELWTVYDSNYIPVDDTNGPTEAEWIAHANTALTNEAASKWHVVVSGSGTSDGSATWVRLRFKVNGVFGAFCANFQVRWSF